MVVVVLVVVDGAVVVVVVVVVVDGGVVLTGGIVVVVLMPVGLPMHIVVMSEGGVTKALLGSSPSAIGTEMTLC
jgi:hypothetical protein